MGKPVEYKSARRFSADGDASDGKMKGFGGVLNSA